MHCIYHSRDLDGYCSGAIVKKRYPDAVLIGFDYGQGLQKLIDLIPSDEPIIMVDVSLPVNEMKQLAKHSNWKLTWVDHHASAIKDYNEFVGQGEGFCIAVLEDGIAACEGVWKYLFPDINLPQSVLYLGIYDTWRKSLPTDWDNIILPFQYGMRLHVSSPETFPMYLLDEENIKTDSIYNIIEQGRTILRYQRQQNAISMKKSFVVNFYGLKALACNSGSGSTSFESVYNEDRHDLMMTFKYTGKDWVFGIYTTKEIDLSEYAKLLGGGGHKKAAGFTTPILPDWLI